jgi:hypothetical protein
MTAEFRVEPPSHYRAARRFHERVDAEPDERHRRRQRSGGDSDDAFDDVPGDRRDL